MNFAENKEELEDSELVKEDKCANFKQNVLHQEKYECKEKCKEKYCKEKCEKAFMDDGVIDLVSEDDPLGEAPNKKEKVLKAKDCKYDKYEKCKFSKEGKYEKCKYDKYEKECKYKAPKECKYDKSKKEYKKDKSYTYKEKDKDKDEKPCKKEKIFKDEDDLEELHTNYLSRLEDLSTDFQLEAKAALDHIRSKMDQQKGAKKKKRGSGNHGVQKDLEMKFKEIKGVIGQHSTEIRRSVWQDGGFVEFEERDHVRGLL